MNELAVVIAGGGPTGLMLAGELALAGVDAAIAERRPGQGITGVDVGLSDGRSLRADYLLGCGGGRSVIRKAAGIEFPGRVRRSAALSPRSSWPRCRNGHTPRRARDPFFKQDGGPVRRCDIL